GWVNAVFTVRVHDDLDPPALRQPVTVDFATVDGTATAGEDYEATSGTLSFAAGSYEQTVVVRVKGDQMAEGDDERFYLELSNPTNAYLGNCGGEGVILEDDGFGVGL